MTSTIIRWKPDLSVGVADVDQDHKQLIKMVNKLFGAVLSEEPNDVLQEVLANLTEYVVFHFDREETYMKKTGYPGFKEHHADHQRLIETAVRFKKNLDSGLAINLKDDLEQSLRDWLVSHILDHDKRMGAFLNNNGVQ